MNKKILSLSLSAVIMSGAIALAIPANAKVKTNTSKNSIKVSTNKISTKNQTKAVSKPKVKDTKVTKEKSVILAGEAVKKYFGYDILKDKYYSKVTYFDYSKDNRFWYVILSSNKGNFVVKVNELNGNVFFVRQSLKNVKLNKTPISKQKALKLAEDFIKNTNPDKLKSAKLVNESFEYKFNTNQAEYYVFEYKGLKNGKIDENKYMYVQVSTFENYVSEMVVLWK